MAKRSERRKKSGLSAPANVAKPAPLKASSSWYERPWVQALALVVAVILVYTPVWQAGFIWDDDDHVTANPCIVGPLGLTEIWTTSDANFFPLTLTTFWLEDALWGVAPVPYHIVTVLLHAACAIILWRVLRMMQVPGAWLGAALWALHPVMVESVAWISETKNTQSALFYLLAILFFLRWLRAQDAKAATFGWDYALTLIFTVLAMASKSSTAFLPVVLGLCAWWVEGRWRWRNLRLIAPVFLVSVAGSALSVATQSEELAAMADPQWVRGWPERFAGAGDAVWFYLSKLIWPYPLTLIYPRWQIDVGQASSYLALVGAIVVFAILWIERKSRARPWFFAYAYFLVALLPGLGLIDNSIFRYSLVFDHFQYLASMGPLALAGAGMVRWADFALPARPVSRIAAGAFVLLILAGVSWDRCWAYQDREVLWNDVLVKNPTCWAAENNLGSELSLQGRNDEAMVHYQRALEFNPSDAEAACNLGSCTFQKGQIDQALTYFQRAVGIKPTYAEAQNNLGCALLRLGRAGDAADHFARAIALHPGYTTAQDNLAQAEAQARQSPRVK